MKYIYTEPYTCYFYKKGEILLYNTLDNKVVKLEADKYLQPLAEELESNKIIKIDEELLNQQSISHFINVLRNTFNGDLLDIEDGKPIPAIFHPVINNQRAFERLANVDKINIDNQVMNYMEEIYIYINGCGEKEEYPPYMQVPSYMYETEDIDGKNLVNWLKNIQNKQINQINILGGDTLTHPHFYEILDVSKQKSHEILLYYKYEMFKPEYLKLLNNIDKLILIIPMNSVSDSLLKKTVMDLQNFFNKQWLFLISSEKEYQHAETLCNQNGISNFLFKPIFNGENLKFFEDIVFMNEVEVLNLKPTKREIYANQKINRNEFGRITVLPNGDIFANPNKERLGNISENRIHDIIYKEMNKGSSWLDIRTKKPCCDCIYQWLCPSPSHYEQVIGKPNLCHIKP